ncbi:MAG: class I SAM-dependent methyltransferase [Hyphomicrobiales bacterium]
MQIKDTLPEDRQDRVGWAYKVSKETERARERFDAWAEDYDRDVHDLYGWNGPDATRDYVVKYIAKNASILDAGAGTGLMGVLLRENGYHNLAGTDISQKMLNVARSKDIYKTDFQADLTKPLPVDDNAFDCIVCVGVSGYMIAQTIGDFVRILKPSGHIIYTISDSHYYEHGYSDVVDVLVSAGSMKVLEKGDEFAALPISDPDHKARVHVYQKRG